MCTVLIELQQVNYTIKQAYMLLLIILMYKVN